MHRRLAIVLIGATWACADPYPEIEFIPAYEVQYCENYASCATEEMLTKVQQRECLEYMRVQVYPDPPECNYDTVAAEACVEALATAGCDDVDPAWPEVCDEVYTFCKYPRLPLVEDNRRL